MKTELPKAQPYTIRISPVVLAAIRKLHFTANMNANQAITFLLQYYLDDVSKKQRMTPECREFYDIYSGKNQEEYERLTGKKALQAVKDGTAYQPQPAPAPRKRVLPEAQPAPAPRRTTQAAQVAPAIQADPSKVTSLTEAIKLGLCEMPRLSTPIHDAGNGRYFIYTTKGIRVDLDNIEPGDYRMPIYDPDTWENLGVPEFPEEDTADYSDSDPFDN